MCTCVYTLYIVLSPTVLVIPQPAVHLHRNYYTVGESDGIIEVCAEVTTNQFEGNLIANFVTTEGSAKGIVFFYQG